MSNYSAFEDDGVEDGCSICLEPFNSLDPPAVTKCKHEYHFQCILEWSQRSYECPICSQNLVLKDSVCQELIAGLRGGRKIRPRHIFQPVNQENASNNDGPLDDPDIKNEIVSHFTAVANRARNISRRRRQTTATGGHAQVRPTAPILEMPNDTHANRSLGMNQNLASCFLDIDTSIKAPTISTGASLSASPSVGIAAAHVSEATLHCTKSKSSEPANNLEKPNTSEFLAFSESIRSKISSVSAKYKESISKSTHGLKEKMIARNESVKELSKEVQREVNTSIAGIARMIERLDFKPKPARASTPLSSFITGTFKSPHTDKRDSSNIQLPNRHAEGSAQHNSLASSPISSNSSSEV